MVRYRRGVLQEGRFGWGGRNGMSLSEGYFWGRRSGGYNMYLGRQGRAAVDEDHPVAAADAATGEIVVKGVFEGNRDYWLMVKRVSGFGLESEGMVLRRIRTDRNLNEWEVPEPVINLQAGFFGDGRVKLEWDYEPARAAVRPTVFKIYSVEAGSGVNPSWPMDSVTWREGQKHYVWNGVLLWKTIPYRLVVRAVTAEGVDDGSEAFILARADCTPPGSVSTVCVEMM